MKNKINLPTKITIIRIIISFLLVISMFILYYLDLYEVINISALSLSLPNFEINIIYLVFLVIFIIGSLTDFVDGYLARHLNQVTDLGKFLDPIADKILVNSFLIFLTFNFSSMENHLTIPIFVTILLVIRDLIMDGIRQIAATKGIVIMASIYGKLKTVLEMFLIIIVLLNGFPFSFFDYNFPTLLRISDFISYLTLFFSILSLIIYIKNFVKEINNEKRDGSN